MTFAKTADAPNVEKVTHIDESRWMRPPHPLVARLQITSARLTPSLIQEVREKTKTCPPETPDRDQVKINREQEQASGFRLNRIQKVLLCSRRGL